MPPTKKVRKTTKIELRNGCSRTEVFFSPKNYKSFRSVKDLQKDWFVECRFHDPNFADKYPKGFQFRKRTNCYETLQERKIAMEVFKEDMEAVLDMQNYNPISKTYMRDRTGELHPYMDSKSAIEKTRLKLAGGEKHLRDVRTAINRFIKGLDAMNYSFLNISEIKIYHIKNTLDYLELSPSYFNKFRQYLSDIFKLLIEYGCVESNPVRDIAKKKIHAKIRELIPEWKLPYIDKYLKENHFEFFRYKEIFYYSGSRSSELLRVQRKHINLEAQEFILQIRKGQTYTWVTKPINDQILKYWKDLCKLSKSSEDFIFSYGLVPGTKENNPAQITKRWNTHVKNTQNIKDDKGKVITITEDFYAFKYMFLDKLDELQHIGDGSNFNLAQLAASHTSNNTTGIYTVNRKRREIDFLKHIKI